MSTGADKTRAARDVVRALAAPPMIGVGSLEGLSRLVSVADDLLLSSARVLSFNINCEEMPQRYPYEDMGGVYVQTSMQHGKQSVYARVSDPQAVVFWDAAKSCWVLAAEIGGAAVATAAMRAPKGQPPVEGWRVTTRKNEWAPSEMVFCPALLWMLLTAKESNIVKETLMSEIQEYTLGNSATAPRYAKIMQVNFGNS